MESCTCHKKDVVTDMVNRVNGIESYDYTQLKMPSATDKTGDGEQFSLAYRRAQEETEDKDKNEETKESDAAGAGRQRTVMQGGVKLELSNIGQKAANTDRTVQQTQVTGQGLIDTVRKWIGVFIQSAKDLLYKIWYDSVPQGEAVPQEDVPIQDETVDTTEPERLTEEYKALKGLEELQDPEDAARRQIEREAAKNKEIQNLLRSGNIEQVLSLVTENGQKTMAKNSTLLTYYDRNGKIAPLSASDQERILHGDRTARKL